MSAVNLFHCWLATYMGRVDIGIIARYFELTGSLEECLHGLRASIILTAVLANVLRPLRLTPWVQKLSLETGLVSGEIRDGSSWGVTPS